jgi:hypothetical protein
MKRRRTMIVLAALAALVLAGSLFLHRHTSNSDQPHEGKAMTVSPTAEMLAEFRIEAMRACRCDRGSGKGCWDKFNRMKSPFQVATSATACAPLSQEGICFEPSDPFNPDDGCVLTGYYSAAGPKSVLAACTPEEAQVLESIFNETFDRMGPPGSSQAESSRAWEAAEQALLAASRDMAAGRPVSRRTNSRGCTG